MTRWVIPFILMAGTAGAQTAVPDPTITPGVVRTTDAADVCSHGTSQLRHTTRARSDAIMAEHGLPGGRHPDYEIDHLIPLGIGGADDDKNLWPEPRATVEPEWNAERKDQLEAKLRALVCAGRLDIMVAQKALADDWTEAWLRYVHFFPLPEEKPFADGMWNSDVTLTKDGRFISGGVCARPVTTAQTSATVGDVGN